MPGSQLQHRWIHRPQPEQSAKALALEQPSQHRLANKETETKLHVFVRVRVSVLCFTLFIATNRAHNHSEAGEHVSATASDSFRVC